MDSYDICTLVPLSPGRDRSASPQSRDWPEERLSLGVVESRKWPLGHAIQIKLVRGSARLRRRVERYAAEWTRHANIRMEFVDDARRAEVRVTFAAGGGSWSMVGTDCLMRRAGATMNLDVHDKTPDRELARVVYHEFGHALGCVHEHQNPVGGIQWDRQKVYDHYRDALRWDEAKVDRNVLAVYETGKTQFSRFDRASIMLYHFPRELTTNGAFVDPNYELSATDIDFIRQMYPMAPAQTTTPPASAGASASASASVSVSVSVSASAKSDGKVERPTVQPRERRSSARLADLRARQLTPPQPVKKRKRDMSEHDLLRRPYSQPV
ncbi:putative peptidase M12 [Rosellinia necatrix]|uniref:Putative peptidase M12 n=1 Tax=Rosellinia necatrix TaxID=77044 RepID=A0A1S7UHZ1_ROSNE|nr:putative peptidase M12 [Rosellinia necatrix]